jgi:hypothetical protein
MSHYVVGKKTSSNSDYMNNSSPIQFHSCVYSTDAVSWPPWRANSCNTMADNTGQGPISTGMTEASAAIRQMSQSCRGLRGKAVGQQHSSM